MGLDYYAILDLSRSASNDEIAQAYRKLSLRLHPDKISQSQKGINLKDVNRAPDNISPAIAQEQFVRIAEAYDVLADPTKRAMYDQFGEEGLKNGVPYAGANGAWSSGYSYHGDASKTFKEFFGTNNPFADFSDMNWRDHNSTVNGAPMSFGSSQHGRSERVKQPDVIQELPLTLEEMFHGKMKKVTITRKVMNEDGHTSSFKDKVLNINCAPGISVNNTIRFTEEGDQGPNVIPADIVFKITLIKHPIYTRNGDDLEFTASVPLSRALVGCSVEVPTLDERNISIPINDIIHPEYVKIVSNEGMPVFGSKNKEKGNLVIRFQIDFPQKLGPDAKAMIRQAFAYEK